jgi:hypothetical protein
MRGVMSFTKGIIRHTNFSNCNLQGISFFGAIAVRFIVFCTCSCSILIVLFPSPVFGASSTSKQGTLVTLGTLRAEPVHPAHLIL